MQGASELSFNDSSWQAVNIPHDFSIQGPIKQENAGDKSYAWYPAGIGWYRKSFTLPSIEDGQKVFIDFDGVYWKSDVWINGQHLGFRPSGYVGFRYDLTPHLNPSGTNVLAVRVDNSEQSNSRWYTGSGIYRHCWLTVVESLHVAHWGTYVTTPEVSAAHAAVSLAVTVENSSARPRHATIRGLIRDAEGNLVGDAVHALDIAGSANETVQLHFNVNAPNLWSPESPDLYTIETQVEEDGRVLDSHIDPLGFRWFSFDPQKGFFLNGHHVKLKGVNDHQSFGGVGAAMPDRMNERRLEQLKEMGCNAIRTSHYPHSPVLMDLCDRMGFLVMDEAFDEWFMGKRDFSYFRFFHDWWERDLTDMIRRDRNHPCVILWSIGNENMERKSEEGAEMARKMVEVVHRLEPTRPVSSGMNYMHDANESGFSLALDVVGYNGGGGSVFHCRDDKAQYPDRKMFCSENPHTYGTRSIYRTHSRHRNESGLEWTKMETREVPHLTEEEVFPFFDDAYHSSYDNAYVRTCIRDSWRWMMENEFMAGEFRWTGFDYLGESHGWPARTSNAGVLDLAGFPKDAFYLYQRLWTEKPMLHILPHWSWPQIKEGTIIPVWAYSNCDSVELFLNGQSLGLKVVGDAYNLSWDVPYRPGVIQAIARKDGRIVSIKEQRTAEKADRIELSVDRSLIRADGQDIAHVTVRVLDRNGVLVPYGDHRIDFEIRGSGHLLGVENGDPNDLDCCKDPSRKVFGGMCLAIVQANRRPGQICVNASSADLAPAALEICSY